MIEPPAQLPINLQTLAKQPSAATSEVQSLTQKINLKVGETTTALVEKVTPLDKALTERMNQLQSSQLQIAQAAAPNTTKLLLAELNIQGHKLLTLTNQLLTPGQSVELKLQTAQQLLLLPTLNNGKPLPNTANTAATERILSESYRSILPKQAPLLNTFRLLDAINQLPQLRNQLPQAVNDSLALLRQHAHTPQQLSTPAGLLNALKQSGVQLENSLNQSLTSSLNKAINPQGTLGSLGTLGTLNSIGGNAQPLAATDLKAALLQANQRILHSLGGTAQTAATSALTLPTQITLPALVQLLQQLMGTPQQQSSHKVQAETREILLQTLQQQLQTAVAKLQSQQLHTLSQQLTKPDQPQAQHWLIELPVRLNNDLSHIEMRIDEEWINRQKDDDESTTEKVRLWTVMLAFDLPERGRLFAQLTIINDTVSANLWAEQLGTLSAAKSRLPLLRSRLDHAGVNVKSIDCHKGQPPRQDIRLGYALVDIKT